VQKCTPLHHAAKKGNLEAIQLLLDLKANIYAIDYRKWTALHYAGYNGMDHVVRMLCKYDDDYNKLRKMKNTQGLTAREISSKEKTKKHFDSKRWLS
jgi:ankyrin repeat protein